MAKIIPFRRTPNDAACEYPRPPGMVDFLGEQNNSGSFLIDGCLPVAVRSELKRFLTGVGVVVVENHI